MAQVPFQIEINGIPETLTVETDPAWGQLQELIKSSQKTNEQGQQAVDMVAFMDKFLQLVIVNSTGSFDPKNLVLMKSLPTSVMTKLIGGVISLVPLHTYLDNMKGVEDLLNQTPQIP